MARYFLSRLSPPESDQGIGSYWRAPQSFPGWSDPGDTYKFVFASGKRVGAGIGFHINLNLLAYARGDSLPRARPGKTLVGAKPYRIYHADPFGDPSADFTINLVPFVQADNTDGKNATAFPIGRRLREFLDDPLQIGRSLKLALPFVDKRISLSQAWMRENPDPDPVIHGGFDFRTPLSPRILHDVHAAADGEVALLLSAEKDSGTHGGVLLTHQFHGRQFLTLYHHLDPDSVKLAVGEIVSAGSRLGTIRRIQDQDGSEISHNHFNLLVQSDSFELDGQRIPTLWYAIDPFGVYDYHETSTYIPLEVGGIEQPIRGAKRTIHWASNPPIYALPVEFMTDYRPVKQIQVRVRHRPTEGQSHPVEHDQVLVYLQGLKGFFFVALDSLLDREIEEQIIRIIRQSHTFHRHIRLGYRMHNGQREITAVWVRD